MHLHKMQRKEHAYINLGRSTTACRCHVTCRNSESTHMHCGEAARADTLYVRVHMYVHIRDHGGNLTRSYIQSKYVFKEMGRQRTNRTNERSKAGKTKVGPSKHTLTSYGYTSCRCTTRSSLIYHISQYATRHSKMYVRAAWTSDCIRGVVMSGNASTQHK